MKQMKGQGLTLSFTTYITFEDVFVESKYLVGKEGKGFKPIMYNFNHERYSISINDKRYSILILKNQKISFHRISK
jgi:hypothetical protein